jgi:hypothetical protein
VSFLSGFHIESAVIIEKISLIPACAGMTRAFHSDNDFILKKSHGRSTRGFVCVLLRRDY